MNNNQNATKLPHVLASFASYHFGNQFNFLSLSQVKKKQSRAQRGSIAIKAWSNLERISGNLPVLILLFPYCCLTRKRKKNNEKKPIESIFHNYKTCVHHRYACGLDAEINFFSAFFFYCKWYDLLLVDNTSYWSGTGMIHIFFYGLSCSESRNCK